MSSNLVAEFNVGEEVTFNSYGKSIKAKVGAIAYDRAPFTGQVSYALTGISEPLTTQTPGGSIEESKHYKPYDGKSIFKS